MNKLSLYLSVGTSFLVGASPYVSKGEEYAGTDITWHSGVFISTSITGKTLVPVGSTSHYDATNITKLLMPIADRWYALGSALGFSTDDLDRMKGVTSTPGVHMVVREGLIRTGDPAKFVNALIAALQSHTVGAEQLASMVAKGTLKAMA